MEIKNNPELFIAEKVDELKRNGNSYKYHFLDITYKEKEGLFSSKFISYYEIEVRDTPFDIGLMKEFQIKHIIQYDGYYFLIRYNEPEELLDNLLKSHKPLSGDDYYSKQNVKNIAITYHELMSKK